MRQGRPILIGTESVEVSEKLSRILKQNKLDHTVLNAKNHAHEAEIIAEAGKQGAITVATNMAGRGTDIKLKAGVAGVGGLHVIGTTRHQSRRIDRQLRGRCARQGDPGSSKFYVSFEDSLMRFSPLLASLLSCNVSVLPKGKPISAKVLNKSIETAQKRVEQRNYTIRKHTLEYDDVMNKQREEIYSFRNEVLHSEDTLLLVHEVLEEICVRMCHQFFTSRNVEGGWNPKGYRQWLLTHFPLTFEAKEFDDDYLNIEDIEQLASSKVLTAFNHKLSHEAERITKAQRMFSGQAQSKMNPEEILREVIRNLLIRNIDHIWQEHLLNIDHLRTEVHLRAVGQKDPLLEFKHEAFALFDSLTMRIKQEIAHALFKFEMVLPEETSPEPQSLRPQPRRRPMIDLSLMPELESLPQAKKDDSEEPIIMGPLALRKKSMDQRE